MPVSERAPIIKRYLMLTAAALLVFAGRMLARGDSQTVDRGWWIVSAAAAAVPPAVITCWTDAKSKRW